MNRPASADGGDAPLSYGQEQLWFLERMAPDAGLYNEVWLLRLRGPLDPAALGRALDRVVARHPALRSAFPAPGGAPVCRTLPELSVAPGGLVELESVPRGERAAAAEALAREFAERPYDVAEGPLIRCMLIRSAADEHYLVTAFHHLIVDAWSLDVFATELDAFLTAEIADASVRLPPPPTFHDYAAEHRARVESGALAEETEYWRKALADAPALLHLSPSAVRPAVKGGRGRRLGFELDPAVAARLGAFARALGSTKAAVLTAAFAALAHRLSGSEDLILGTAGSARPDPRYESAIGYFSAVLPLRVRPTPGTAFADLVEAVTEASLDALDNQDVPFNRIVEELGLPRDPGFPPLVQVVFAPVILPDGEGALRVGPLSAVKVEIDRGRARFDLLVEAFVAPHRVAVWIEYDVDLFDDGFVRALFARYDALLGAVLADPGTALAGILLPPGPSAAVPTAAARPDEAESEVACVAETATMLAIWREVLAVPDLDPFDDLFASGGHSLLAARLAARIEEEFDVALPLRRIFEYPTAAELAEQVVVERDRASIEAVTRASTAAASADFAPLAASQRQIWIMEHLDPGGPMYNIPLRIDLAGPLDTTALCAALDDVVARHEVLRCVFTAHEDGPRQSLSSLVPRLKLIDLSGLNPAESAARTTSLAETEALSPFDLAEQPPLRGHLVVRSETDHTLILVVHHIALDGVSAALLSNELVAAYRERRSGRAATSGPTRRWFDYCAWESEWLAAHRSDLSAYWADRLAGLVPLEPATGLVRPDRLTFDGAHHTRPAAVRLGEAFETLSRTLRTTAFSVFAAAVSVSAHRMSGQQDFALAVPTENRLRPDAAGLIGCCVNVMPLRVDLGAAETFAAAVHQIRERTLDGHARQALPFPEIVRQAKGLRRRDRLPLPISCAWHESAARLWKFDDCESSWDFVTTRSSRYDLSLTAADTGHGVRLQAEYNTNLWTSADVEAILAGLERIVLDAARDPEASWRSLGPTAAR